MSHSISILLTRNLQEVFGENDPARQRRISPYSRYQRIQPCRTRIPSCWSAEHQEQAELNVWRSFHN